MQCVNCNKEAGKYVYCEICYQANKIKDAVSDSE